MKLHNKNGNLCRMNSGLTDMRYVWDTHNRLLAVASNGYVSTYLYDGDGERTVKQHGGNEAVYTNGAQAAINAEAPHYTLYPNPYFVLTDGDKYTKHIYINGERVAVCVAKLSYGSSDLGNFNKEDMAGGSIVTGEMGYGAKLVAQEQVISACYDSLQYPYKAVARPLRDIALVPGGTDTPADDLMAADSHIGDAPVDQQGTANPKTDWQRVYYYNADHLGSSRLVMNQNAEIAENLMYLPTGEVFKDELNTTLYHSDFLFSGKELDAETGNYYYGARYLAPKLGIWLSPDPMQLKYPHVSSYAFCHGNPVNRIDLLGMDDYELNSEGYIYLKRRTEDHYDNLIHRNNRIRINDKKLLPQFTTKRNNYNGNYAITSNEADAGNLFLFSAKNSDVEWGLNGYQTQKGKQFLIRTSHDSGSVGVTDGPFNLLDMFVNIHSHVGKFGKNYASGYGLDPNKNSNRIHYTEYSDYVYMNDTFNAFKAANKLYPSKYPRLYIYVVKNNEKIEYNYSKRSIPKGKVNGYHNIIK